MSIPVDAGAAPDKDQFGSAANDQPSDGRHRRWLCSLTSIAGLPAAIGLGIVAGKAASMAGLAAFASYRVGILVGLDAVGLMAGYQCLILRVAMPTPAVVGLAFAAIGIRCGEWPAWALATMCLNGLFGFVISKWLFGPHRQSGSSPTD